MGTPELDRRQALKGLAAAAGGMTLAAAVAGAEGAPGPAGRLPRGLVLSCSSLAFSDVGWEKALEEIGKLGFRRADLAMFEGWTHVSPSELEDPEKHAAKIRAACARLKVEPIAIHASFNPGRVKDFPGLTTPEPQARRQIVDHFERVLACARAAEVPLVNVQPGKYIPGRSRRSCLENAIEVLREMERRSRREGVALSFENHKDSIGEQPRDALELLEAVDGLRLDYDFSHIVACGIKVEETTPLLKYVAHVAVRNAKPGSFNEPTTEGGGLAYDLKPFLDALRRADVNAHVSVEYYQPAMRPSIAPLKAILEKAGVKGG